MSYELRIAKVEKTFEIPGADRIHGIIVCNETLVAKKHIEVGFVGVFAEEGTQLSEEFCHNNNLYREANMNKDKNETGFFENTRRVRAQAFKGVKSSGCFFELDSLSFTGVDVSVENFKVGQLLSVLNGYKLSQKYMSEKQARVAGNQQTKQLKKSSVIGFNEHIDTKQFKHTINEIPVGSLLNFHAKIHGTSFRVGKHLVLNELPLHKRIINKLFNKEIFPTYEYDYVVGSRRVIIKNENTTTGFHGSNGFRYEVLEKLKPFLENGMSIYGEIAGYVNGSPIMGKHNLAKVGKEYVKKYGKEIVYSYGCDNENYRFHIYRITHLINGKEYDLSARQIEHFCEMAGVLSHMNIHEPIIYNGNKEELIELVDKLTERPEVLTEDYIDPTHISEGIIIRVDNGGFEPKFYKNKSFAFKIAEGIYKENNVDLEDAS